MTDSRKTATHDACSDVFQPGTSIPVCAGKGDLANFVEITADSPPKGDGAITRYYHVMPTVTSGHVDAGTQVGTVDTSGCSSGAHVHVQRKSSGVYVNFAITGCALDSTKLGLGNTWNDDGPFSF